MPLLMAVVAVGVTKVSELGNLFKDPYEAA